MSSSFIDYIKINVQAGNGGAGSIHFRREKFLPKGGPDGGDGGNGGNIIIKGNSNLNTLLNFRYKRIFKAQNGTNGSRSNKSGQDGKNLIIEVPLGTVIKYDKDLFHDNIIQNGHLYSISNNGSSLSNYSSHFKKINSNDFITEITKNNKEYIIANGGKGGYGNSYFKSSTRQSPKYAQPGLLGEHKFLTLELKLLADIGLIGLPNSGKSSLIASITAVKPKIGNYPFTTITPNIGIVSYYDNKSFIIADIPGIIQGAYKGKGLGLTFLRHIERNSVLSFVIDASEMNVLNTFNLLINELKLHNKNLLFKKKLLILSKADLLSEDEKEHIITQDLPNNIEYIFVSAMTNQGLLNLKGMLWSSITDSI